MKKQQRNILQKWKDKNIRFLDERLQLLDTIKEMVRLEIKNFCPTANAMKNSLDKLRQIQEKANKRKKKITH